MVCLGMINHIAYKDPIHVSDKILGCTKGFRLHESMGVIVMQSVSISI